MANVIHPSTGVSMSVLRTVLESTGMLLYGTNGRMIRIDMGHMDSSTCEQVYIEVRDFLFGRNDDVTLQQVMQVLYATVERLTDGTL